MFLHFYNVTPSDTENLPETPDMLYVGGAGDVHVLERRPFNGTNREVTFTVPAGKYLFIRPSRVFATGTTATNIIALHGR